LESGVATQSDNHWISNAHVIEGVQFVENHHLEVRCVVNLEHHSFHLVIFCIIFERDFPREEDASRHHHRIHFHNDVVGQAGEIVRGAIVELEPRVGIRGDREVAVHGVQREGHFGGVKVLHRALQLVHIVKLAFHLSG